MAIGFLPPNPQTGDPNSLFMKSWFKQVKDFCRKAFGLADIQTTSFTASDQEFYPCNTAGGNIVVTLPVALDTNGKPFTFKKTSGLNTLTIVPTGTDTIEGAVSYAMTANGSTVTFRSDGQSIWYIHSVGGTTGFLASPLTTKGDLWGYSTVDARVPIGANTYILTADSTQALGLKWAAPAVQVAGADTQIQFNDGGSAFGADADFTWNKTTNTLTLVANSSVLAFSGTGPRITGDMNNATNGSRLLFQGSVVNGNSTLGVIPNGTSTTAGFRAYSKSDPSVALNMATLQQSGTITVLDANVLNSGTQGTLEVRIGANPAITIDANRNTAVGKASLATNATDGFCYIPSCAGTPTGVPTAITGYAPLVIDSTNNKLYAYIGGAWQVMN